MQLDKSCIVYSLLYMYLVLSLANQLLNRHYFLDQLSYKKLSYKKISFEKLSSKRLVPKA